jgi:hypothetical protein
MNSPTVFFKKTDRWVMPAVVVFCALPAAGAWPGWINRLPDAERFLTVYFKGPFLFNLVLWMTWALVLKHNPFMPAKEFNFLNSLPLSSDAIVHRFLFKNLKSGIHVPLLSLVPFWELSAVSPIPHLCRLGFLWGSAFVLSMLINARLQLAVLSSRKPLRRPVRGIILLTVFVYATCHFAFILSPEWASGLYFAVFAVMINVLSFALVFGIRRIFARIQHSMHSAAHQMTGTAGSGAPRKKNDFYGSVFHPLLVKQFIQWKCMRSRSSLAGAVFLIAASFLAGANNARPRDRAAVMLVLDLLYIVFFAVDGMQRFSTTEENSQIIHSLPLGRRAFFMSAFAPVWTWLAAVFSVQGVLLSTFNSGFPVAAAFFVKVLSASCAAAFAAAAFICHSYPEVRPAQNRFLYWVFGLFLALCLGYPLRIITTAVFMVIPARSLAKTALYRSG